MHEASPCCDPEVMDSEDTLFMLYTSGSTGRPKGIVHSTAGYLLYSSVTFKVGLAGKKMSKVSRTCSVAVKKMSKVKRMKRLDVCIPSAVSFSMKASMVIV
jgi:acyl-CoA synthetase (AMP-forming)/AMP-acid ligase II